jgi:hypothetical protein
MKTRTRYLRSIMGVAALALVSSVSAQTLVVITGNHVNGGGIYVGARSGSPAFGLGITYHDSASDAVTFRSARVASWLWENPDGGSGTYPSMRLDQANNLILYTGTTEAVKLSPSGKSLTLGGSGGAVLTNTSGTALSTNGAFTVNGSFAGGTSGLNLSAGTSGQPITLATTGGGDIVFSTGGAERARIKSTGNVGIGTTNPQGRLQLGTYGDGTGEATHHGELIFAKQNTTFAATGGIEWKIAADNYGARIDTIAAGGANLVFGLRNGSASWTEYMRINPSGNVGLGTSDAAARLTVSLANPSGWSGNMKAARIWSPDAAYYLDLNTYIVAAGNVGYQFSPNGNTGLVVTTPGNVGIGTTAPSTRLHVSVAGDASTEVARFVSPDVATNGNNVYVVVGKNSMTAFGGVWGYQYNSVAGNAGTFLANYGDAVGTGIFVRKGGNVGIGTTTPTASFHVRRAGGAGSVQLDINNVLGSGTRDAFFTIVPDNTNDVGGFLFRTHNGSSGAVNAMAIMASGNVGIGTTNIADFKLAVGGKIRATEVVVDTGWADYVFEDDYRLAPLSEVEAHIRAKKHLPGVPSAADVAANGVSMGEMQATLLAKVEELTLHLIRLEKENGALKERVNKLESSPSR